MQGFAEKLHGRGITVLQSDGLGIVAVLDWARSGDQIDADDIAAIDRIGITIDNGVGSSNEFAGMRFDEMAEALKGSTLTRDNGFELNVRNFGITSSKLGSSSVTTAKIATDAVTNVKIADSAVESNQLASNSVQTSKIVNNAVTQAKIATNAVGAAEIQSNAVGGAEIKAFAVDTADLAGDAVTQSKIADAAVGVDQLKTATGSDTWTGSDGTNTIDKPPSLRASSLGVYPVRRGRSRYNEFRYQIVIQSSLPRLTNVCELMALFGSLTGCVYANWDYITSSPTIRPCGCMLTATRRSMWSGIWEAEDPGKPRRYGGSYRDVPYRR